MVWVDSRETRSKRPLPMQGGCHGWVEVRRIKGADDDAWSSPVHSQCTELSIWSAAEVRYETGLPSWLALRVQGTQLHEAWWCRRWAGSPSIPTTHVYAEAGLLQLRGPTNQSSGR